MPFNFRKTKTMKLEKGNYGTGADAKSDQGKYEAKVREFLGYCKNFNNLLVRTGNDGEVKNVEDIRKCFNDGFKNYYKDSKKYSLFSHTTKVLKGMEKELKKLAKKGDKENKGSLTIDGMAGDLKKAFDYKPKRSGKADEIGKRSAIDDRAVYGFFTATLPKTLTSLCKKAKEEKVAALEEQNDTIEFIKKSFEDLDELRKKAGGAVENAKRHSLHQGEQVEEIKAQNEVLRQTAEEQGTPGDQKTVDEQEDAIKKLEEKREETKKRIEKLNEELEKKRAISEKLSNFDIEGNLDELMKEGNNDVKENLRNLLKTGNENETDGLKLLDALDARINELSKDLEGTKAEAEKLEKESAGIDSEIKKIKEEQNKLGKEIKKGKETQEKKFNLVKGTLTINGKEGAEAYWVDYNGSSMGMYLNEVKTVVMNGVEDISGFQRAKWGGMFHSFEKLTSVTAKNLRKIGNRVFDGCKKLASFNSTDNNFYNIPADVEVIGAYAFDEAGSEVAEGFSANVGATTIGKSAFASSGLREINLPNATIIGPYAFSGCTNLAKVTLGQNKLKSFKENAFDNNEKLTIYVKTEELQKELLEKLSAASRDKVKVKLIKK